jgi:hypothetical protein
MSSGDGRLRSADGRLGQLLAHAGDARGPLRQPARRLLGCEPRREKRGGRGPVFPFGLKRNVVHSSLYQFVLIFFQKQLMVFLV